MRTLPGLIFRPLATPPIAYQAECTGAQQHQAGWLWDCCLRCGKLNKVEVTLPSAVSEPTQTKIVAVL
jgi:hypothetical protein